MYVGNVGGFFYKDKEWVTKQPKITKENKYNYIAMGGKIFKINIYSGELNVLSQKNNKFLFLKTLKAKKNNKELDIKKNKTNINLSIQNKKENKSFSSIKKNIFDLFQKKNKKKFYNKRNKSSNIKTNFSLTTRNYYNKTDKLFNIYLNKKYVLTELKKIENRNRVNCLTYDSNRINSLRYKFHNFPLLDIKKQNENNDDDDLFIQEDICEIKKEDNGIITKVKNQLFKDKLFKSLKKQYNFYEDNKNSFLNIPKINLDKAQNLYFHKKSSAIKKINLSKISERKNKILDYNFKPKY